MRSISFTVIAVTAASSSIAACSHQQRPPAMPTTSAPVAEDVPPPPQPAPSARIESTTEEATPAPPEIAPASVYFRFDSADLTDETRAALQKIFDEVQQRPDVTLRIEGNCDERGTTEYNLALGQRRADAAKGYLSNLGLDASRIATLSYGNERPRALGHDEAAWRENRRDDVLMTTTTASNSSP